MRELRVLVTGARHTCAAEAAYVHAVLRSVHLDLAVRNGRRPMIVVQGKCPYGGVDLAAEQWALRTPGVTTESHPANWERHGGGAGPIRNAHMVALGADLCLAFPGPVSRGTWDCIRKACAAGIKTRIYPLRAPETVGAHA